jgi:exopolyphosphatase/guanosine-5'-triphosphate,3'-diphosphate pyrophosphatase
MRRAVIDIGSNTVKLLVADVDGGQVRPLVSKAATTRLGEGVGESKRLTPRAVARTLEALGKFIADAKELAAANTIAFTTSAVREAQNRGEFLGAVRDKFALEVEVITGEREAELIFRGAASDPAWAKERILVMDVGGGSAEFILGNAGAIERAKSLPLGAVRLTEKFRDASFVELTAFLRATFHRELAPYHVGRWRMIGTGGTITTLANVRHAKTDHARLSLEQIRALVSELNAMTLEERKRVPGLPPERADIIVAGGAVFLFAMEALNAEELTVSMRNLRYGALLT